MSILEPIVPSRADAAQYALLGFWDPCIGENKKLRIRYSFRDNLHEVTVSDMGSVRAPVRGKSINAGGTASL